jgi:hypothetical protein
MDIKVGDKIVVTDYEGIEHEATITEKWGDGGTVNANSDKDRFTSVPYYGYISPFDRERGYYWKYPEKKKDTKKKPKKDK